MLFCKLVLVEYCKEPIIRDNDVKADKKKLQTKSYQTLSRQLNYWDICFCVKQYSLTWHRSTKCYAFLWNDIVHYYTPKYTMWASEQFDWFTLTILWLHITLIYLLWRIQVAHIAWIYLLWWIRLIRQQFWSTAVLQVDAAQLTLLAVMLHMMDSLNFNLKSLHKQWPKQCWSFYYCLTCAHLFTSSSFIDFRRISKKCISWRMLTKLQQGRQSRVGHSFAIELQDFMSLLNRNTKLVESVKI